MVMEVCKKRGQLSIKMTSNGLERTTGIHGRPITFGIGLTVWYDELKRHLEKFRGRV